ncbi:S1 family peptidase [Nocardioides mangrovi]|uniref:S1 family peptidase n=1 Tax=Nocardioides mangrovi TaxID=2874580 RepID=A0ABS7U969_9ACTN|nr:S1 family peptidase [Nocardioides mangrovi]MBZ5737271.1 S1 family peptidase [Nocardioides mangrovi]
MRITHRLIGAGTIISAGVLAAAISTAAPATSAQSWAPADSAAIHPGTMMYTEGAQCTANFVFTDGSGATYVGYAAHCAGTGSSTDTDGCSTQSLPLGTKVTFNEGGSLIDEGTQVGSGTLAYSSWNTMHSIGETDANTCAYNDLALVKVDAADVSKVNPSIPFWGGPTGIDTDGTAAGDRVWTYGNSSLRAGISVLSPHTGISLGDQAADGGWSHPLYTVSPGIPGDSGSAFVSADGKAIGVLSTLGLAPLPASNNIGDLGKELAYAQAHSGISGLQLVNGTEPFDPVL